LEFQVLCQSNNHNCCNLNGPTWPSTYTNKATTAATAWNTCTMM
jgi:hypothetical protein